MIELNSIQDLVPVANQLLALASDQPVWCFKGEMGAGKTTLIKAICDQLNVTDTMKNKETIYHFDFYRIKSPSEALDIGIEEYFYSGNYCFIEWPELVADFLPERRVEIMINLVEGNKRVITLTIYGEKRD
jgi:tRNA threonylcarbamoyladenosine biosynthesis protein TsaE